jgi:hypothetical protein
VFGGDHAFEQGKRVEVGIMVPHDDANGHQRPDGVCASSSGANILPSYP